MKRIARSVIVTLTAFAALCLAEGNSVVGKWACTSNDGSGNELDWTLVVKQEGTKLAGLIFDRGSEIPLIDPTFDGNVFAFKLRVNGNCTIETKLKVEGDKFEGKFACPEVSGTMKGVKQP